MRHSASRLEYRNCRDQETLTAIAKELDKRVDASRAIADAVKMYLTILDQREADEAEYAAAGYTYCQEQQRHTLDRLRRCLLQVAKVNPPA